MVFSIINVFSALGKSDGRLPDIGIYDRPPCTAPLLYPYAGHGLFTNFHFSFIIKEYYMPGVRKH